MRLLVRLLAVVGALTIVAVVATAVALWSASRPASEVPAPDGSSAAAAPAQIRDVKATAAGMSNTGGSASFSGVDATGVVPFDTVERQVGRGVALEHDGQGRVRLTAPVTALGRTIPVTAIGRVRPDGNHVVVEPDSIDVPGPDLVDAAVSGVARAAVTIREPVRGLPAGLSITDITVADDGLHVRLVGERVTTSG